MKPIILFLFLLFNAQALANSAKTTLLTKDAAAFRVQNKIVFTSELNNYISQVNTLRCFKKPSLLLEMLKIDKKHVPKLTAFKEASPEELSKNLPVLRKLVRLLKAQIFANKQRVSIESDFVKTLGVKGCLKGQWDEWDNELKSLVQAELFFRDRFKSIGKASNNSSKQFKESMLLLLETIDKKIEHDFFF